MNMIHRRAKTLHLSMVDSRKPIRVDVTKTDVSGSQPKNPACCPVARAIKRQPGVSNAFVFRTIVWVEERGKLVRYSIPESLRREIVAFDRGGRAAFSPGSYHLSASRPRSTRRERAVRGPSSHRHLTEGVRTTDYE